MLTLAAYEGDQLLGIIRTVGDGHTIVFVQDILVFPEHQRKGFGSALLQAVLNRYSHVRQIELATDHTPKTIAFYKSMGFLLWIYERIRIPASQCQRQLLGGIRAAIGS